MNYTNIMIVEDESLVALEIQESLENLGYSVTGLFSSGEETNGKIFLYLNRRPTLY